jgi:spermidine/putrescine-binding protein
VAEIHGERSAISWWTSSMRKGVPPTVLSFWGPDQNGVVQNDFVCIGRTAKNPALAHEFVNFFLRRAERVRQLRQLHGLHPSAEEHRRDGQPTTVILALVYGYPTSSCARDPRRSPARY